VILLLWYCLQALWCRFRYGVTNFYYIPAPGKSSALYRDWVVMLICRPFFKRVILHWHAAGLAKWLELTVGIRHRAMTYRLMKQVDLSIVLSGYNRADAEKMFSHSIQVVSNGIPDPCPGFAHDVSPRRKARFAARRKLLSGQTLSTTELECVRQAVREQWQREEKVRQFVERAKQSAAQQEEERRKKAQEESRESIEKTKKQRPGHGQSLSH